MRTRKMISMAEMVQTPSTQDVNPQDAAYQAKHGENGTFRVLTMNLALVTPGIATLRYYMQIILAAIPCMMILFIYACVQGYMHPTVGCLLVMYGVFGAIEAKGLHRSLACLLAISIASFTIALYYYVLLRAPLYIVAGFGWFQLTYFFGGVILGRVAFLINYELFNSYIDERVELFLQHLKDSGPYDAVCVQEASVVWGCKAFRDKLEEGVRALGYGNVLWTGRWPRFPAVSTTNGLGIFSRHPITDSSVHIKYFKQQYTLEWAYTQRGFLCASLELPGSRRVDICTLHNTASVENTGTATGLGTFNEGGNSLGADQVLEAIDWFAQWSPCNRQSTSQPSAAAIKAIDAATTHAESRAWREVELEAKSKLLSLTPVLRVLCGDFNFEKETTSFKSVSAVASKELGMSNVEHNGEGTFGNVDVNGGPAEWCLTFGLDQLRPRLLDYIFADRTAVSARVMPMRNNDETTRHLYQQASDHSGVEAVFALDPARSGL